MSTDKKTNKTAQSIFSNLFSDNTVNQTNSLNADKKITEETTLTNNTLIMNTDSKQTKTPLFSDTDGKKPNNLSSGLGKLITQQAKSSTQSQAATPKPEDKPAKPVEMQIVDVVISGSTYPINCPVDEKEDLEKAELYINHFIREIRKDAPTLSHENLLVLCCLNMYEEMKLQRNTQASLRENDRQMHALIDKIHEDAKSILR